MPITDFGRVADIYDATRSLPGPEMSLLLKAVRGQVRGSGPIIDVGVGTGRFAQPLQKMGIDVLGIDISRRMMTKAVEKGVRGLLYADVRHIPFRNLSTQSALLVHVLHLVHEWPLVVKESARVARASVMSVIETRSGTNLREKYLELRKRMGYPLVRFDEGLLMKRVKPRSVTRVADYQRTTSADVEIGHLLERGQSLTWDVPQEVHTEIIETLRSGYGGRTLRTGGRIELVVWSAKQLREEDFRAWGPSGGPEPARSQKG